MSAINSGTHKIHTERAGAFGIEGATLVGPAQSYNFGRSRIVIGRGHDVDLSIEHSAVSRRQLAIERVLPTGGQPRFRIVPLGGCNTTFVNGQPAVEGSIQPGELVAVGPVRLSITLPKRQGGLTRSRRLILLCGTLSLLLLGLQLLPGPARGGVLPTGDLDAPLFHRLPSLSCPTADACAARAHERYLRGRQYEDLAQVDPGNLYRAAIELAYAAQLRLASGQPLVEIQDAGARVERDARRAQQLLDDARFALQRASASGDRAKVGESLANLERLVPEAGHPIRAAVDRLKRDLAKSAEKSGDKK